MPSRLTFLSLAAVMALSACANRGGSSDGGGYGSGGGGEPQYGGIQTKAIGSAPASREASTESRPLSELDTPDAIAAREYAKENRLSSKPAPASGRSAAAAPAVSATAETQAALAAAAGGGNAHRGAGLQKGSRVRVRAGAPLYARPSIAAEKLAAAPGEQVELGTQMYNADGYWWYVGQGKDGGWLSQTDILK
jgi:hypothetical protein